MIWISSRQTSTQGLNIWNVIGRSCPDINGGLDAENRACISNHIMQMIMDVFSYLCHNNWLLMTIKISNFDDFAPSVMWIYLDQYCIVSWEGLIVSSINATTII